MGIKKDSNFFMKFSAGSLAGAIGNLKLLMLWQYTSEMYQLLSGSMVGNPFDVLKTQLMATEGKEPPSLAKAAQTLYSKQGVSGFYRGIEANVMRAMVLNGTKMACYDQIKQLIVQSGAIPAGPNYSMLTFVC